MQTKPYPIALPADLMREIRQVARETHLSMADVMRQSMKLGFPKLREELSRNSFKPLTREECRQCWEVPDPEFDALAAHCAGLPVAPPEE